MSASANFETLEPRQLFAAAPLTINLTQLSAAAGGTFNLQQSLPSDDGRIYALGINGDGRLAVAALDARGRLDVRFGDNGIALSPVDRVPASGALADYNTSSALTRDSNGNLYVVSPGEVIKFRRDGRRDYAFGRRGAMMYEDSRVGLTVNDTLATADGRLIVAAKTLHGGREKYYLYEIGQNSSRLAWYTNRSIGSQSTVTDPGDDAVIRPYGRGIVLDYRQEQLNFFYDRMRNGRQNVVRRANVLTQSVFDRRLREVPQIPGTNTVEITAGTKVGDARVQPDGFVRVALDSLQTLVFRGKRGPQRLRETVFGSLRGVQFSDDNTLVALRRRYQERTDSFVRMIYRAPFGVSDAPATLATIAEATPDGTSRMFDLQPDSTVLATGKNSRGEAVLQRIRPGVDDPVITLHFRSYYGHVPYQHITYTAPSGITKASVDRVGIAGDDLIITAPTGEQLVSGISGAGRGQTSFGVRYWINGPGGAWGPEDDGIYTVSQRLRSVQDGLGVYNSSALTYTFNYVYADNVFG